MTANLQSARTHVELIGALIAKNRHRPAEPTPHSILACGAMLCRRIIVINSDGTQKRIRKATCDQILNGPPVTKLACDHHGGAEMPSSAAIEASLILPEIHEADAAKLVAETGLDTSSDSDSYVRIALKNGLVKPIIDMAALGLKDTV